jgi:hypothetical protein
LLPLGVQDFLETLVSLQLLNPRESVELLGREINASQDHYLTQTQKKRRHPCHEWNSNPRSQCWSEPLTALPLR